MTRYNCWFSQSFFLMIFLIMGNWSHTVAAEITTTFYVVRHAEKPTGPHSDRLTFLGAQRAKALQRILHSVPLAAIYSTDTRRTWETATPTAVAADIQITPYDKPQKKLDVWVQELITMHKGKHVLIVGHSDTVPIIVRALNSGRGHFDITDEYDNLFIASVFEDHASKVQWQRYSVIETLAPITFKGDIHEAKDISAAAMTKNGQFLIVGMDEGTEIHILRVSPQRYEVVETIALRDPDKKEIDIEGLTRHGSENIFYAIGSHSLRRKNIFRKNDQNATYGEIKKRFEVESPDREKNREHLIRFELDPDTGQLVPNSIVDIPLRNLLDHHQVFKPFSRIPSKENGIDIEGIASDGVDLYLGFRGPVLRHGFTPVLVFPHREVLTSLHKIENPEVRYVKLDGRGIRDIARVAGGFLIVAGPVGDAPLSYQLYFWDGNDCLPGKRGPREPSFGEVVMLGTIPTPLNGKAEAIALLSDEQNENFYEFLILYDGLEKGNPTTFRASHPSRLHVNIEVFHQPEAERVPFLERP